MNDAVRMPPPLGPRHWPAWLGIGIAALLARVPWSLQRVLGRGFGRLLMRVFGSRRRVAARNLALCFPELDADAQAALLRRSFEELGIGLFEFARAWWGSVEPMRGKVAVEGLEHLEAARAGGRGGDHHLRPLRDPGTGGAPDVRPRAAGRHVPAARRRGDGMGGPARAPALRPPRCSPARNCAPRCATLKQGGLLWFAPDQDTRRGDSVFVPFFGRPAYSLTSTHQLARLSGAAVLGFAHVRHDDGGYTLRLTPAFEDFPSSDATADTARVMAAIETMIRAAPAQYLWIHRRFKRQPDQPDNALYR
jgi:KDO2-lipid IV(A) lauroyltransferase